MSKYFPKLILLALFCVALIFSTEAYAQQTELELGFSRDFGYSSGTGDIQGTFSMHASGPDDLARVVFLVDGQSIGEVTEAPFKIQFSTDSFTLGLHTLSAIGYTTSGKELRAQEYQRNFVSAEEGWKSALKIAGPILALAMGISVLSFVFPLLAGRGKSRTVPLGAHRNYGFAGGAICPKCQRPFAMHLFGLNLLVGKLDRCPYCGKWSVVRAASHEMLRAAEAAELTLANQPQVTGESEDEKLRKELDDSRFQNY